MNGLQDRVAVVTGAGQGIGHAIVRRFLDEGVRVLAVDKSAEGLAQLPSGPRLRPLHADVTQRDAPESILRACHQAFGPVELLINNAGVGNAPPVHETTDEVLDFQIDVNLRSTFRISREALADLRANKGVIVNTASATGLRGYRRQAAYSAAKAGVVGLTRCMAADYGPDGVRVNAIAPGLTATPTQTGRLATKRFRASLLGTMPLGWIVDPAEIAGAAAFLCSSDARSITGQVLAIDAGQTETVYLNEDILRVWEDSGQVGGDWDTAR